MEKKEPKFVEKEYMEYHGYDGFINFLMKEKNRTLHNTCVLDFIRLNIKYQKKTGWNRFIGLSGLINFTEGIENVIKLAKDEFGYDIKFIENEANIINYIYGDTLAINRVEYTKLEV